MMEVAAWSATTATIVASLLASFVEVVEAFTIVLAVGTFCGWRPALFGTGAGLVVLAGLVLAFGPVLGQIPIHALQFGVGVLLLLFGMRWLRKAVLRAAGIIALHDEQGEFAKASSHLQDQALNRRDSLVWIAGLTAFKAIVLEGIEVVFVVLAVGAGHGNLWAASLGAGVACVIVLTLGLLVHKPLATVPENLIKLAVGVMLSAFGVYWTGEGLGISWPGQDLAILVFAAMFLSVGLGLSAVLRRANGVVV
jgi:uncharacterized membrane protein